MKWALVNDQNIVENVIAYDGESEYRPPEGLVMKEVNDWIEIGMDADMPHNDVPRPTPPDPVIEKKKRDDHYKNDLSMVALFNAAKRDNPQLTLSAYLDSLEQLRGDV